MRSLLDNIKHEYEYIKLTKIYLIVLLLIISVLLINQYNSIRQLEFLDNLYTTTIREVTENGGDIDSLLKEDYTITNEVNEDGSIMQTIENIVSYDFEQLQNQIIALKPANLINNLLKSASLIFFPIISAILGIYIATYDFQGNTLKTRSLIGNTKNIYLSKIIVTILTFTVTFFVGLLIGWLISILWSVIKINSITSISSIDDYISLSFFQNIKSILISYTISLFFLIVSFNLGLLVKKVSIAVTIFLLYHLLIPNLGSIDIKNIILNIYESRFTFQNISIPNILPINLTVAYIFLILYISISIALGYLRLIKTSKYTI